MNRLFIGSVVRYSKRVLSGLGLTTVLLNSVAQAASYNFTILNVPGAYNTNASGINNNGTIVGGYQNSSGSYYGFLDNGGAYSTLGQLLPGAYTQAYGINNNGAIVGHYFGDYPGDRGYLYNNGSYTTLTVPFLGVANTQAYGINNNGAIVGTYDNGSSGTYGFLDNNGSYTSLNVPGSSSTSAFGISGNGEIVGTYFNGSVTQGFLYNNGTYTTLNAPGARDTYALGISGNGAVVGWYSGGLGAYAFVYDGGAYTSFSVPGATKYSGGSASPSNNNAFGINDNGVIVGGYQDRFGSIHGFLATPTLVPLPASSWLMSSGLLALLGLSRRKTKDRDNG